MRKKRKKLTKHHVVPRSRGGGSGKNIIMLFKEKHEAYHAIFGNRTFIEAAKLLIRAERLKGGYYDEILHQNLPLLR